MTEIDLAQEHFKRGAFSEAADALIAARQTQPLGSQELLLLGVSLARARRNNEAIPVLEEVISLDPDTFEALTWLAVLTKSTDGGEKALEYAERAIQLRPNDARGYSALGACHQYHRRVEPAIDALKRAASLAPEVAEHQHNLALVYLLIHDHDEARKRFRRAIALAPRNPQSYLALAEDFSTYGSSQGLEVLQQGLAMIPNSPALYAAMGKVLSQLHKQDEAERHYQHAAYLSRSAQAPYAAWLLEQGRFSEASSIYEEMANARPAQGLAYYGMLQARKVSELDAPLVSKMQTLRNHPDLGPFEEMHLRYALGKVGEQTADFEAAMSDYDVANRLAYEIHIEGSTPGIERFTRLDDKVIRCFENLARTPIEGSDSAVPIFIVGMIRSGTTLLDQIISSHPSVTNAGELRYWIESISRIVEQEREPTAEDLSTLSENYVRNLRWLAGNSERVTDKMPLNFAFCGVIHRAMPNAKFVHIRRHPVDTCLSVYTTYFGPGTPFAYRKENIVAYYREYQRMMEYWSQKIPQDRILTIDYEELTDKAEPTIRRVIEFAISRGTMLAFGMRKAQEP